jgi:regulator of extracellular matrix RemA (YlzA/DUF370 family)
MTELVHVGFGSVIAVNRVIAFLFVDQQPIRRLLRESREKGLLIDATHGRKVKTAILFDSGHILSSAIEVKTIVHRPVINSAPSELHCEMLDQSAELQTKEVQ